MKSGFVTNEVTLLINNQPNDETYISAQNGDSKDWAHWLPVVSKLIGTVN